MEAEQFPKCWELIEAKQFQKCWKLMEADKSISKMLKT
jgi:hypothetical protein